MFLLLSSIMVSGDVAVPQETSMRMPDEERKPEVNFNITYDIQSVIAKDNMETATYIITAKNVVNTTTDLTLTANFNYRPEELVLKVDGELEEFRLAFENEDYGNVRYENKFSLAPDETKEFEIDFERLVVPNKYEISLWGLDYNYNTPINLNYNFDSWVYENYYVRSNREYMGRLELGYEPSSLNCNGCTFDRAKNVAVLDNSSWFNINWEKERIPLTSSIVYLLMVAAIIGLVLRAKKKN